MVANVFEFGSVILSLSDQAELQTIAMTCQRQGPLHFCGELGGYGLQVGLMNFLRSLYWSNAT